MLFNSFSFIFIFLPVVAIVFFSVGRRQHYGRAAWFLGAASVFFYGWWDPAFVPLLLASVAFNYSVGRAIVWARSQMHRRSLCTIGIVGNLSALFYYKYAGFVIDSVNQLAGWQLPPPRVTLPIGISFFTFTQIAYLVDTSRGLAREYKFSHYLLFVTYFPHLIAGPILHHSEMMPQFQKKETYGVNWENLAVGLTILVIGLFKKVILADAVAAPYSNAVFAQAHLGTLGLVECWAGALAYTFQLYFDFSGYSDMAIGISRMFNVTLPLNFDSPYKAASIIDFWRRWHMTLSRFLKDYLYVPLGGNRKGPVRRYINLWLTMALGGLWHGANWTFLVWGALHGVYLIINHGLIRIRARGVALWPRAARADTLVAYLGRPMTFVAVVIGWVIFRADSLDAAWALLKGMAGVKGVVMPWRWQTYLGFLGEIVPGRIRFAETPGLPGGATEAALLLCLLAVVWAVPNTQEILRDFRPALNFDRARCTNGREWVSWRPSVVWLSLVTVAAVVSISRLTEVTEFLYFQF